MPTTAAGGLTRAYQDQFDGAYQADMRSHLDAPPVALPLTVHLSDGGTGPDTYIFLIQYSGPGQGTSYRTPAGLAAGDYAFTFQSDGTVASADGKVTLTSSDVTFAPAQQGRLYAEIYHPTYQGQTGVDGREILRMNDMFGRAGLSAQYFFINNDSPVQTTAGNCLVPWPDGNQITPTLPAPA